MQTLKIFKSSAGSGKTFTLVLEYLKLVINHPEDYKSILAITFTNMASEEMKSRIIEALVSLNNGEESSIRKKLEAELPKIDITVRAGKALKNILHDYSSFSVSTIDSFFQRILRALAREINLPLNMQVQVELDDAILDATDRLLKEVGVDADLTEWLTRLSIQKMEDDKGWSIEKDIEDVGKELFKEERHNAKILSREEIKHHYKLLVATRQRFENKMKDYGEKALLIIRSSGLDIVDYAYGSGGVAGYFNKICNSGNSESYKPGNRVKDAAEDAGKWASKKSTVREEIVSLAESTLIPLLNEIIIYQEQHYLEYMSAVEILKKIYLFGIVNDLQKKFTEFRNENSIILLSDTTRLLSDIIDDNDAPFLYEKTGNRYKHLLIDEFQDTSLLQWKNLLPLIINALGSGFTTLVVGDAKQSIYRWRGGNMNLLLTDLFRDLKSFQSMMKEEVLRTNYRSKREIVEFNNAFFSQAPGLANDQLEMNNFSSLNLAYGRDLLQETFHKNDSGGYVKINFLKSEESDDGETSGWKENAMKELLKNINDQLSKGFSYKDICILVRKNTEGNEIANMLFNNGIHEIISPDSLLITASPRINFVISIFRFLSDHSDSISRSEILYYYRNYILQESGEGLHSVFIDHKSAGIKAKAKKQNSGSLFEGLEENVFNKILPEAFTAHLSYLAKLPVYELSEQLISIFRLNNKPDAYIQRLQDLILEFTTKTNSSLEGFLNWWDTASKVQNCSVIVPGNTDAIRIMTIHRSKGLQFPIVMIPFAEWKLSPKANTNLWMNTEGTPFKELGVVALSSGKKLLETYFKSEYETEINQTIIDNLNLLYVAFTRAEEKLFISCPADNDNNLTSVSKLIYRTCNTVDKSFSGDVFENGLNGGVSPDRNNKEKKSESENLQSYPGNRWQEKLALGTHSGDLLSMLEDKQLTKINYGILVHSVLAGIKSTGDITVQLEKIVFDGLIGKMEMDTLRKEIEEILNVPEINEYFDKSFSVLAERDILLPDGEVFRPDRVIIKNNNAIVIDFKTGKRDKKHIEQLKKYSEILQMMNYAKVESKIVYLADREIVSV